MIEEVKDYIGKSMRDIKFRAWDEVDKKIVNWDELNFYAYEGTLMQYTGLNDKNDVEIYEGSIVQVYNTKIKKYEVGNIAMNNLGCWSVVLKNIKVPMFEFIDSRLSLVHDFSRIEVIGNIYENIELSQGEKYE